MAWLELWVVVPFWYIAAIRSCLHSGEMLAVSELGVVNGCGLSYTEKARIATNIDAWTFLRGVYALQILRTAALYTIDQDISPVKYFACKFFT